MVNRPPDILLKYFWLTIAENKKKDGDVMATTKGFWQHIETGDIYAVESTTFGKIVGGVGPLDPDNLQKLEEYKYTPAINQWLKRALAENKLHRINPD